MITLVHNYCYKCQSYTNHRIFNSMIGVRIICNKCGTQFEEVNDTQK